MICVGDHDMELTVDVHFEEGSYWAHVQELPGCFAAGDSLEELFTSVGEGVELYLQDDGISLPRGLAPISSQR